MDSFTTLLDSRQSVHHSIYSYQYLRNNPHMGYHSETRDGALYHCLNQDIMLSILQYRREKNVKISMYCNDLSYEHEITDPEMPRHKNDFIELTYVLQGEISVIIDQETHIFKENELYLINPNVSYQEEKSKSTAVVFNISLRSSFFNEMLLANIPSDSLQGFLCKCLMNEKSNTRILHFQPTIQSVQKQISDAYSHILAEYKSHDTGYMFIIQGYFTRLLSYLVSNYQFSFSDNTKLQYKEYLFQEVKKYLYTHYQTVQLSDLEEQFHYSGSYFNRLIQSFTGKSYSAYLIHIRLKIAKEMLEHSTKNVDDIMICVGYHNKGFFYKIFTEAYGKPPAAWRREYKLQKLK